MQSAERMWKLLRGGLFLESSAYETINDSRNPFVEGLFVVVALGLVVAVAGIVGTTLEWASVPNPLAIGQTVYDGLTNMPWYEALTSEAGPDAVEVFQNQWDWTQDLVQRFAPTPLSSLTRILTVPSSLIVRWLVYGLLAHVFSRLLGGEASLSQTLGVSGLALTPHVLHVLQLLPFSTIGGVVATWTLLCRYVALKQAHRLSWSRTLWAAILPFAVSAVVIALLLALLLASGAALVPYLAQSIGGLAR